MSDYGFTGAGGSPLNHEPYAVTIPLSDYDATMEELRKLRKEAEELRCCANCRHSGKNLPDIPGHRCAECHSGEAFCIVDEGFHEWGGRCINWEMNDNFSVRSHSLTTSTIQPLKF